jgi:hypothetical protein
MEVSPLVSVVIGEGVGGGREVLRGGLAEVRSSPAPERAQVV